MFSEELVTCTWHYFTYDVRKEKHTTGDWIGKRKDGQDVYYYNSRKSDAWLYADDRAHWAYRFYHGHDKPFVPGRLLKTTRDWSNLIDVPRFQIDWDKVWAADAAKRGRS